MCQKNDCCKTGGCEKSPSHTPDPTKKKVLNITGFYDIDAFLDDVFDTMAKKGHDYRQGNDSDLLHNFRTVADSVGIRMEQVWYTYFYKHYSAMVTYIKEGGQSESEPIEGRIKDQIVYLVLFWKMVQERKRVAAGDTFPVSTKFPELNAPLDYDLQAGSSKAFDGGELQALIDQKVEEIQAELRSGRGKDLRIKDRPTMEVPIGVNAVVELDLQKVRRLSGLPGVHVDPDVKKRAAEIHRTLEARDQEASRLPGGAGFSYAEATVGKSAPAVDERAVQEAVAETTPLHEREAGRPMYEPEPDEDEIAQGRAANGAFDGPDIPF